MASTGCSKRGFWRVDGGRKVKKWVRRLDDDVDGSRTWGTKWVSDKDGWICSRRGRAMLHKTMEIRSK